MDLALDRIEQMQALWMQQIAQTQEQEERLITNIMDTNNKMVAAVLESIRGLQQPMLHPPEQPNNGPNYYD